MWRTGRPVVLRPPPTTGRELPAASSPARLGLTIALGQAEVPGARLAFANVPEGEAVGAPATLTSAESRGPATNGPA